MAKISLNKPTSGFNLAAINENFTKIEQEFQNKVLYRNNPVGEANTLETSVDVNSKRLYNLGTPLTNNDAARLQDVRQAISGLPSASLVPFSPINGAGNTSVQGAITEIISSLQNISVDITAYPFLAQINGANAAPAINAAIAYVAAKGGGVVKIPGNFNISTTINLQSNVSLDLTNGKLTQIANSRLENLVLGANITNFEIKGGEIDINEPNQSYSLPRSDVGRAVLLFNCSNFKVNNQKYSNIYGSGLLLAACNTFWVEKLKVSDTNARGDVPVKLNTCNTGWVRECILYGKENATGYGIEVLAPSFDINIESNDLTFYQIVALNETSQDNTLLVRIRIVGNTIKTPSADSSIHWSLDSVFSYNIIINSGDVGMSHDYSIRLSCVGNVVDGANASCLAIPGGQYCVVVGNMLRNPGRQNIVPVTPGQRCGIWMPSTHNGMAPFIFCVGCIVQGNTIVDDFGGMYFGISVANAGDSSNRNLVPRDGNYIDGPLPIDRLYDMADNSIPATQWMNMVLTGGWVNYGAEYGPVSVFKEGNSLVHLRGMSKSGTVGSVILTLPVGFRPPYKNLLTVLTDTGSGVLVINTDGAVILQSGGTGYVSFEGCSIRAT